MRTRQEKEALKEFERPGYLTHEERIRMHLGILKTRILEGELYERKMRNPSPVFGTVFDSEGQEAIPAGVAIALRPQDVKGPSHRDAALYVIEGIDSEVVGRQFFGKKDGPTHGRDLNWHVSWLEKNILRFISHMGALAAMAPGVVWAKNYLLELEGKLTDRSRVVGVMFMGEGASRQGVVMEALNFVTVLNIPMVYVFNLNQYGISTLPEETHPFSDPLSDFSTFLRGFGLPAIDIRNGWDAEQVFYHAKYAIERARNDYGPSAIAAHTFRLSGHNKTQNIEYMKVREAERQFYLARDPVAFSEYILLRDKLMTKEEIDAFKEKTLAEIKEAFDRAEKAADPEPTDEDLGYPVSDPECTVTAALAETHPPSPTNRVLKYGLALNEALYQAMEQDDRVIVFGEDVKSGEKQGGIGGVYGITRGLTEKFGIKRCFNTPISEADLIGFAGGLALGGLRPVVEMQFFPFITCGYSQLVDVVATHYAQTGRALPLVVRVQSGYGPSTGHYHAFMYEQALLNVPGLKVVFPADAFEAKAFLLSAIADSDPVVIIEQIHAFYRKEFERLVPERPYYLPLGKARLTREGSDISLITYGALMVHRAVEAAKKLADENVSVEVLNLCSVKPLDTVAILDSYAKTGRALVMHEAVDFAGFNGEVVKALAGPEAYERSRWGDKKGSPILTIGAKDAVVPGNLILEDHRLQSGIDQIVEKCRILMEYGG